MAQKDVGNKVPIYKLKKTDEVMKYYDEWGEGNKYDQDMIDWNYTGPKETSEVFIKYQKNKDAKIYDAGCGTGLVGVELKKYGFSNFYGADLSQKLLDLVPTGLYQKLNKVDLNKVIEEEDNDDPNYWLRPVGSIEVSNTGEDGYQNSGEVRLIGNE